MVNVWSMLISYWQRKTEQTQFSRWSKWIEKKKLNEQKMWALRGFAASGLVRTELSEGARLLPASTGGEWVGHSLEDLSPAVTSEPASVWREAGEELGKLLELKSKRNLLKNNNNNKNMSKAARYRHMRSGCAHCWLFMCCNVDCWLEANYTLLHGRGKRTEFSGEGSLQTVAELTSYATLLTSLRLIYNSRYSHKYT